MLLYSDTKVALLSLRVFFCEDSSLVIMDNSLGNMQLVIAAP